MSPPRNGSGDAGHVEPDDTSAQLEAAFRRVERTLDPGELPLFAWVAGMVSLREIAGQPAAPLALRLRFAQRWLTTSVSAADVERGAAANDKRAYLWAAWAAHRGDVLGQVLLAHCYRCGRGVGQNWRRARTWYRAAARAGSSEADFWLRCTSVGEQRWWERGLLYRGQGLVWLGLALVVGHCWVRGFFVDPGAVGFYLLVTLLGQLGIGAVLGRRRSEAGAPDAWSAAQAVAGLARKPWELLAVAGEDGLVVVPVLGLCALLGAPWLVAPLAGAVFGLLHFPNFSWRACFAKGLCYAAAVAVVLPWGGLGSLVVGHMVLDALIVAVSLAAGRGRTQPSGSSAA